MILKQTINDINEHGTKLQTGVAQVHMLIIIKRYRPTEYYNDKQLKNLSRHENAALNALKNATSLKTKFDNGPVLDQKIHSHTTRGSSPTKVLTLPGKPQIAI